jgi:2-C-methyl-D-erythritol 4-phosphate cytidylyltransferase
MEKYAIIVAGGKGERMNAGMPKQFLPIGGVPVLMRTLEKFYTSDKAIRLILVLPETQFTYWKEICEKYDFSIPHQIVGGGETRFHSVKNGLAQVSSNSLVAVHDGVRPFVSEDTINRCYTLAMEKGVAIPVVESVDSIRLVKENGNQSVDRTLYRMVQTPQVFQSSLLKKAFEQTYSPLFTDDASVVEAMGSKVFLTEGNRENIKITTPFDLKIAEALCAE